MNETYINTVLRDSDIEGLIENGVPDDEYASEASDIAQTLSPVSKDELSLDVLTGIIALIWQTNFDLSKHDIDRRYNTFRIATEKILQH